MAEAPKTIASSAPASQHFLERVRQRASVVGDALFGDDARAGGRQALGA